MQKFIGDRRVALKRIRLPRPGLLQFRRLAGKPLVAGVQLNRLLEQARGLRHFPLLLLRQGPGRQAARLADLGPLVKTARLGLNIGLPQHQVIFGLGVFPLPRLVQPVRQIQDLVQTEGHFPSPVDLPLHHFRRVRRPRRGFRLLARLLGPRHPYHPAKQEKKK